MNFDFLSRYSFKTKETEAISMKKNTFVNHFILTPASFSRHALHTCQVFSQVSLSSEGR
jgi:hypothetical protein